MVPDHRGIDDRYRILFSISRFHSGNPSRNYFPALSRANHLCALLETARWRVALDLCDRRGDVSVFQPFRIGRAVVPENLNSACYGSNPNPVAFKIQATTVFYL